jgi:hypothetical protein
MTEAGGVLAQSKSKETLLAGNGEFELTRFAACHQEYRPRRSGSWDAVAGSVVWKLKVASTGVVGVILQGRPVAPALMIALANAVAAADLDSPTPRKHGGAGNRRLWGRGWQAEFRGYTWRCRRRSQRECGLFVVRIERQVPRMKVVATAGHRRRVDCWNGSIYVELIPSLSTSKLAPQTKGEPDRGVMRINGREPPPVWHGCRQTSKCMVSLNHAG